MAKTPVMYDEDLIDWSDDDTVVPEKSDAKGKAYGDLTAYGLGVVGMHPSSLRDVAHRPVRAKRASFGGAY
jgi:hypothetical protein